MATIKAIEASSVHRIQSGQVIVDLCSVVKELVENSLDAGATSIEVRFKNSGYDSIEIQDNGGGIAPEDFNTIALKHYTSKLSAYDDLNSLQTFGFRGEALSSLCALSKFHIITARANDGSKGTRLDFESSGKLKSTTVVASQKGTTVVVENIFYNVPVRRKELDKNLKREYGKVLGILHAYACISRGVRFSVSNQVAKGKKIIVFSTKANPTTRENIANVYGAKTLQALIPLDLKLAMEPSAGPVQSSRRGVFSSSKLSEVLVQGHISRPSVGEGRQTPDRQMFFVNSRPCGLPQVAKAINEVYKSYNIAQSPFIFANLVMDTNDYDVNVSPDKRTILLHDQNALLESLKVSLIELFQEQDQRVPQSQLTSHKLPLYMVPGSDIRNQSKSKPDDALKPGSKLASIAPPEAAKISQETSSESPSVTERSEKQGRLNQTLAARNTMNQSTDDLRIPKDGERAKSKPKEAPSKANTGFRYFSMAEAVGASLESDASGRPKSPDSNGLQDTARRSTVDNCSSSGDKQRHSHSLDSIRSTDDKAITVGSVSQKFSSGVVPNAFDRMRSKRTSPSVATITIGDKTTVTTLGPLGAKRRKTDSNVTTRKDTPKPMFGKALRAFVAPGNSDGANSNGSDEVSESSLSDSGVQKSLTYQDSGTQDEDESVATESESSSSGEDSADDSYVDEEEEKAKEEARIAQLIAEAESNGAKPSVDNTKRATTILRGGGKREPTLQLLQNLDSSVERIENGLAHLTRELQRCMKHARTSRTSEDTEAAQSAEERLSLTISKKDFARMRVAGQFNLGFILAVRSCASEESEKSEVKEESDELFIIDQHASDEKYNFERLQAETVVQNQRLVQPRLLDLTAIEEETILSYPDALSLNGFVIDVDTTGDSPVGRRCKLVSLPMSREVVFGVRDLEELLALLSEQSGPGIPRPSKVRKMFAMRACRSSIMVGKTLTVKQMERVVRNMGEIDKPWNCPHGRPTMRHLFSLDKWQWWTEGDGLAGSGGEDIRATDWASYLRDSPAEDDDV